MNVYIVRAGDPCFMFQGAFLCEECGEKVRADLRAAGQAPDDEDDEHTYDSDDFPKGPYDAEDDEYCDAMDGCLSLVQVRS